MKYLLALFNDESRYADRTPEERQAGMQEWDNYTNEVMQAGVHLGGEGLQPSSAATTVQIAESGDPIVSDGPFAETKEHLGGFLLIEAKNLAEAMEIAERDPLARMGAIEVRETAGF